MSDTKPSKNECMPVQPMRVSAAWGHRFRLTTIDGGKAEQPQARTRGKRIRPVCGDLVMAAPLAGERDWLIDSIAPRDNELARPDARGRREVLAANIELIVVVACAQPAADFFIVDRYLAAARLMPCEALLVWNKSDLAALPPEGETYRRIGYAVIETSTEHRQGIETLAGAMSGRRSILVGQSGVGKSSLINALANDQRQRTSEISSGSREGRHTTVAAELLRIRDDIEVIDSPGVRDYAPSIQSLTDVAHGFIEIAEHAQQCRFANCMHRAEPGCDVKRAVADGDIDERRYASFLRLTQLTRQLNANRH